MLFLICFGPSPSLQLRAAVADIPDKPEDDDYFYLRWLRARKFKVKKAEEMLRNVRRFACVSCQGLFQLLIVINVLVDYPALHMRTVVLSEHSILLFLVRNDNLFFFC